MTTSNRTLGRRLLLALGVLLGLLLCGLLALWLLARQAAAVWPHDVPPIAQPAPALPVDEGSWQDFLALGQAVGTQDMSWLADAIHASGQPDDATLGRWREHEAALQAMDRLVARRGLHGPAYEIDAELPPTLTVLHAAHLRLLRAWWHAAQGRPLEASLDLQATARLGLLLEQAGNTLLLTMVGLSVQDQVVDETEQMLATTPGWPADALAPLAQGLLAASAHPSGMLAGLAAECLAQERLLRRLGGMSTLELFRQAGQVRSKDEVARAEESPAGGSWFFDVEATAALARQRCQRRLENSARPVAQRQTIREPRLWPDGARMAVAMLDNPIGRILLDLAQPDTSRFMERSDRVRARRALLGLRLAIQAFALQHEGSRPLALTDLVPELAPALPVDPYSGESLLYDREAGTLDSAGSSDELSLRVSVDVAHPASSPAP